MNERERIEYIMEGYGLSSSQFADKTGIPRASVSHILSGRNKPSLEVLQRVAATFTDVDIQWLMMGIGEAPALSPKSRQVGEDVAGTLFSDNEESLITATPIAVQQAVEIPKREQKSVREEVLRPVKSVQSKPVQSERTVRKPVQPRIQQEAVKRIKEIRVFYSDGTFEILYPEK